MKILPYQINLIVKCRINYRGELEAVRKLLNHWNLMVTQSRRVGIVCLWLWVFMYVLWANKANRCNRQCEGRIGKSLPTDCRLQWRRIQQKLYLILGDGKAHKSIIQEKCSISQGEWTGFRCTEFCLILTSRNEINNQTRIVAFSCRLRS